MKPESWIDAALYRLNQDHAQRTLVEYNQVGGKIRQGDRAWLNFSGNDYLDLAHHPAVIASAEKALREYGAGSTASRLLTGTLPLHSRLETRLARFKGYPAALLFGSGYMTNAGVLSALAGRGDHVFADKLIHASVIDAITLSRARLHRFHHNDPQHLETLLKKYSDRGRRLIVTESVFSMDGDLAPLRELSGLAARYEALFMVDEAHATGVFGPLGSGLIREHHLESAVTISMGTLSKALGSYGGFVACSHKMREWLVNRARAFIYTTSPAPAVVGAALGALDVVENNPDLGKTLLNRAAKFRARLNQAGLDTLNSASQIVPIRTGSNARTLAVAERLRQEGILAAAIRPPTVPRGEARLRLSLSLAHSDQDLELAAQVLIRTISAKES